MNTKEIQNILFSHDEEIRNGAEIFDVLGNECRLEMFIALMSVKELSS